MAAAVKDAADVMQDTVARMRTGVDDNLTRMGGAAERLDTAANKLSTSLQAMSAAADAVDDGIDQLTSATKSMNLAVTTQNQTLGQHQEVRDAVATMVGELRRMLETATRDASVNDRLVKQIETSTERLVAAQREADTYLDGVTETLAGAHEAFANTISSTLQRGNAEFHGELGSAIDLLRSGIQDLGDLFDNLPTMAQSR